MKKLSLLELCVHNMGKKLSEFNQMISRWRSRICWFTKSDFWQWRLWGATNDIKLKLILSKPWNIELMTVRVLFSNVEILNALFFIKCLVFYYCEKYKFIYKLYSFIIWIFLFIAVNHHDREQLNSDSYLQPRTNWQNEYILYLNKKSWQ